MTSEYPTKICSLCGSNYHESYLKCVQLDRMIRDGICFMCAHWNLTAERGAKTVIDHCVYTPGSETTGDYRGCGGRRFDIEYLDTGRRITTFDLWVGGVIPERLWSRLPDTAKFLSGAERVQVGETTCFNPSDNRAPTYPSPTRND